MGEMEGKQVNRQKTIPLGFEIPSGDLVSIPARHMVITGQTQCAGKTTTLEALIGRSGCRAITFVTKRGEESFTTARRIEPYFREQADWQYVAAILEAYRGERMKFERAQIIRASKGAMTLAQVHHNVKAALAKRSSGRDADIYEVLNAYLDAVVPQIQSVRWATSVDLHPGVNVMDLTGINAEMQHLVIRSTIEWVQNKETDTIIIIPEAWKFIPEGRGTPVKLAAEALIRQSAVLRNYVWLDSQDITGVEKLILKSIPLWILGVQREINEIKRTLAQIPTSAKKPKAEQVATLGLGQFFACWGEHVYKTYVWPAWMSEETARGVATGAKSVDDVHPPPSPKRPVERKAGPPPEKKPEKEIKMTTPNQPDVLEQIKALLLSAGTQSTHQTAPAVAPMPTDEEALYQRIKARLMQEAPALVKLLAQRPEMEVEVERVTLEIKANTQKGRLASLIAGKFFDNPKKNADAKKEMVRTGGPVHDGRLSEDLSDFVRLGFLTREDGGFKSVPGMKARIIEKD